MAIVVQKFGGSSVATPELIQAVADRVVSVCEDGDQPVVVVSAMGRTTDALVALAAEVSQRPHRREMDMILTAGERVSMALLAMAINDRGREAISLTGSQAGIITTTEHNRARIIEVRPVRVFEALQAGQVVIVGGFAGVSTDKEVTTLGRGGSDTTAIALAAALRAERCDICSDVDGVYTADPRVVPDAHRIDQLAHGEILEMGLRGAGVLAPEAVDYARRHGITLHARSTFGDGRGTVITAAPRPGVGRATSVAADANALPLSFEAPREAGEAFLTALREAGLPWKDARLESGERMRGELVLDTLNTPDAGGLLERLRPGLEAGGGALDVRASMATVTVVGAGLAEQAGCWRIARETLAGLGVTPKALTASPWGITAQVPRSRLQEVTRAWHAAFPGLGDAG
jgi:aspartate kinase